MGTHQRAHRPSQESENALMSTQSVKFQTAQPAQVQQIQANKDEPILTAANKLLNELKKAYSLILQEKEEQILHLKEEVSDLKTLVRVLESENDRLRR